MLAETSMVRLEAAARALKDTTCPSNPHFVGVTPNTMLRFKESRTVLRGRAPEAVAPCNLIARH